jgi:uncharacterized protein YgbK (DUF1537 family)
VIGQRIAALRAEGVSLAVVDALNDDDPRTLAQATSRQHLVVAGSGLAIGIPAPHGLPDGRAAKMPPSGGATAVLSGSCSAAYATGRCPARC